MNRIKKKKHVFFKGAIQTFLILILFSGTAFILNASSLEIEQDIDLRIEGFSIDARRSTGAKIDSTSSSSGSEFLFLPGSKLHFQVQVVNKGADPAQNCTLLPLDWPLNWGVVPEPFDVPAGKKFVVDYVVFCPSEAEPGRFELPIRIFNPEEERIDDNGSQLRFRISENPYPLTDVGSHWDIYGLEHPTDQTALSDSDREFLREKFFPPLTLKKIGRVYRWIRREFKQKHAGGDLVAERSAQEIYDEKKLTGCNDWGILLTAIFRALTAPVVFMNGVDVDWARTYRSGQAGGYIGHTFLEIYLSDTGWMVFDSVSGHFLDDYDYRDNVITVQYSDSSAKTFFIYQKGKDQWEMGVRSREDNRKKLSAFGTFYPLETIKSNQVLINKVTDLE